VRFWRQNRRVITTLVVVLALVFSISYTSRPRGGATTLEVFLLELLAPVQAVAERTTLALDNAVRRLAQLNQVYAENERLRKRLATMEQLAMELEELRRENLELRRYLGLLRGESRELPDARIVAMARVIGRNPDNWFQYLLLNRGSRDGVRVDMVAIVPPRILVGRVIRVTPTTATLMLITDPESGVGASTARRHDAGVVLGPREPGGLLEMQFFARSARPYEGQVVLTSGLGGIFPRNLLIGTIKSTGYGRQGVLPLAYIDPFADLDHLEYVLLVERTE